MESPSSAAPSTTPSTAAEAANEEIRTPRHYLKTYGVQLFALLLGIALAFM